MAVSAGGSSTSRARLATCLPALAAVGWRLRPAETPWALCGLPGRPEAICHQLGWTPTVPSGVREVLPRRHRGRAAPTLSTSRLRHTSRSLARAGSALNEQPRTEAALRRNSRAEEKESELLAALARHPVFTKKKERSHPKIGFKRVDDMFHWDRISEELGVSAGDAMSRSFGRKHLSFHFLQNRLKLEENLAQLGIVVCRDLLTEAEEADVLRWLRHDKMVWQSREYHGQRANFGPTLTTGYRMHRDYHFTEIPAPLQAMRTKALQFLESLPEVRGFSMNPPTREGFVGHNAEECFNQALIQRYRSDMELDQPYSQALPMHKDQRDDWAEIIAGVSVGAPGHIFFSSSKPDTVLTYAEMQEMVARREGILIDLPQRSMYAFYGFARYGLCHGVPALAGCPVASAPGEHYDRITVTWRSVRPPLNATLSALWPLPTVEESAALGVGLWGQSDL